MAGEIEEPFSFNFLADSLHSGSISFGRFECEPLSWERRSSFSHNRYLEEVKKCSKPGSVTEKKAYFEAHFRKKALLSKTSSNEGQNGSESQTTTDDMSDISITYQEECKQLKEGDSFAHFDEIPSGSDVNEECEMIGDERADTATFYSEPQTDPALKIVDGAIEVDLNHDNSVETGCSNIQLDSAELIPEGKEILLVEKFIINDIAMSTDSLHTSSLEEGQNQQSIAATGNTFMKTKSKSLLNAIQPHKQYGTKPFEASRNSHSKREIQSSQVVKSVEKQSLLNLRVPSVRGTSLLHESRSAKANLNPESKSVKDLRTKEVSKAHNSPSGKKEPGPCQTVNRPERIVKSSSVNFNFKSDARNERRKEFCVKLEKKIHAKEAEMNQIQAKTQEKTEAELKHFRKGLNFKAIPMPSFYLEAAQLSDKSKALSSIRPTSSQSKASCTGRRSSSHRMVELDNNIYTKVSDNATDSPPITRNKPMQISMKIGDVGKNDQGKDNHGRIYIGPRGSVERTNFLDNRTNLKKKHVLEGNKAIKGKIIEGNQIGRKDGKGIGLSNGRITSNLPVGSAS